MNKIIELKFGSHLYKTDTPNSDLDLKAIYLPTAREILLGSYKKTISTTRPKQMFERNNKDDVDLEVFSLDRFLELMSQGQTVALDFLFGCHQGEITASTFEGRRIMDEIFQNRTQILSKNVNSFVGYAKQQAARYGQKGFRVHGIRATLEWVKQYNHHDTLADLDVSLFIQSVGNDHIKIVECKGPNNTLAPHLEVCDRKYPFHARIGYVVGQLQRRFDEYGKRALLAERNEGLDYKALSHAVRVNSQAKELLETGFITFPRPDRELLLKIKTGQMDYKEVANLIEDGLEQLHISQANSSLRETPNQAWIDDFIVNVYSDIITNKLELT